MVDLENENLEKYLISVNYFQVEWALKLSFYILKKQVKNGLNGGKGCNLEFITDWSE